MYFTDKESECHDRSLVGTIHSQQPPAGSARSLHSRPLPINLANTGRTYTTRTRTRSFPQPHSLPVGSAHTSRTHARQFSAQGLDTRGARKPVSHARPGTDWTEKSPLAVPSARWVPQTPGVPLGSAGLLPTTRHHIFHRTLEPYRFPWVPLLPSRAHPQVPRRVDPEARDRFPRVAGDRGRMSREEEAGMHMRRERMRR